MPFIDLPALEEKEIVAGFYGKFAHAEKMTVSFWRVEAGATLPEHTHPHEQISVVLAGKFEMTLGGETRQMEKGSFAIIPADFSHSGKAITACEMMDIFSPVREDYR
jgi:quercetin dioxygenase-like cupin family protein